MLSKPERGAAKKLIEVSKRLLFHFVWCQQRRLTAGWVWAGQLSARVLDMRRYESMEIRFFFFVITLRPNTPRGGEVKRSLLCTPLSLEAHCAVVGKLSVVDWIWFLFILKSLPLVRSSRRHPSPPVAAHYKCLLPEGFFYECLIMCILLADAAGVRRACSVAVRYPVWILCSLWFETSKWSSRHGNRNVAAAHPCCCVDGCWVRVCRLMSFFFLRWGPVCSDARIAKGHLFVGVSDCCIFSSVLNENIVPLSMGVISTVMFWCSRWVKLHLHL